MEFTAYRVIDIANRAEQYLFSEEDARALFGHQKAARLEKLTIEMPETPEDLLSILNGESTGITDAEVLDEK